MECNYSGKLPTKTTRPNVQGSETIGTRTSVGAKQIFTKLSGMALVGRTVKALINIWKI